MAQYKKMILVPENVVVAQPQHTQPTATPHEIHQSQLDDDIQRILKRHDLSIEQKWKYYQQALNQYLHFVSQAERTVQSSTNEVIRPVEYPESNNDKSNSIPLFPIILQSVPKTLRSKTDLLLKQLQESNKISWGKEGTVSIHGKNIAGSNIIDLINDVVRSRKTSKNPVGIQLFTSLLEELNIPKEFISTSTPKKIKKRTTYSFLDHWDNY